MIRRGAIALVVTMLGACSGTGGAVTTTTAPVPARAASPTETVNRLLEALRRSDLAEAAGLVDPDQLPLVALTEGEMPRAVAGMEPTELRTVGENFWAGFVDQFGTFLSVDVGDLRVESVVERRAGRSDFAQVEVVLGVDASRRSFVCRRVQSGWVLDLVASFPSPLLVAIPGAFDAVRQSGDAELIAVMKGLEDSARYVLEDGTAVPELNQAALAAVEAIER